MDKAPRVHNWVQSGSSWPSDSKNHQIIQFQAVLAKFNQLQLPINHSQLCKKLILHSGNLKRFFFLKNPVGNLLLIGNWRFHLNPSIELWKDFADALFFYLDRPQHPVSWSVTHSLIAMFEHIFSLLFFNFKRSHPCDNWFSG